VLQSLIHSEIAEISLKIAALDGIRAKLEQDLLKLHEDDLELDDERVLRYLFLLLSPLTFHSRRGQGEARI
jgi:hypothetical protein